MILKKSRVRIIWMLLLGIALLPSSCTPRPFVITGGSHVRPDEFSKQPGTWVVWSDHPAVGNVIIEWVHKRKGKALERARLQQILNEQKIQLTNTRDDEADILRVGKMLGATNVVFGEATVTPEKYGRAFVDADGAARSMQGTVYHVSVTVRAVRVESGEIQWSGTAHPRYAINNPEVALVDLTEWAINRAVCPVEEGYEWDDLSGCRAKQSIVQP